MKKFFHRLCEQFFDSKNGITEIGKREKKRNGAFLNKHVDSEC